jgi:hypothetical protein
MPVEYKINVERFNKTFSRELRELIAMFVQGATRGMGGDFERFREYWTGIGKAFNRHHALPKGIPILDDLFPPNIAVLDWLLEMNISKKIVIADIPCGLGNLMFYLKELGFEQVWGYDNWSQIEKERAEKFLRLSAIREGLVDLPTILEKPVTILASLSLPFDNLSGDIKPLIDKVRYILLDSGYVPKTLIEGFEEVGRYPGLLVVYKRKIDSE